MRQRRERERVAGFMAVRDISCKLHICMVMPGLLCFASGFLLTVFLFSSSFSVFQVNEQWQHTTEEPIVFVFKTYICFFCFRFNWIASTVPPLTQLMSLQSCRKQPPLSMVRPSYISIFEHFRATFMCYICYTCIGICFTSLVVILIHLFVIKVSIQTVVAPTYPNFDLIC